MVVHARVAAAGQLQIETAVPRQQRQHVVQKAHAAVDLALSRAVKFQPQGDVGLGGLADDFGMTHSAFLQNSSKRVQQAVHLLAAADGDAVVPGQQRRVEMAHEDAAGAQFLVELVTVDFGMAGKHEIGLRVAKFKAHFA